MFDPAALADMTRVIDEALAELDEGISYIVLSRYMPPGVVVTRTDDLGRLYGLASEETVDRLERLRSAEAAPDYYGFPIVRLVPHDVRAPAA